jgi:hypothetical protein
VVIREEGLFAILDLRPQEVVQTGVTLFLKLQCSIESLSTKHVHIQLVLPRGGIL